MKEAEGRQGKNEGLLKPGPEKEQQRSGATWEQTPRKRRGGGPNHDGRARWRSVRRPVGEERAEARQGAWTPEEQLERRGEERRVEPTSGASEPARKTGRTGHRVETGP